MSETKPEPKAEGGGEPITIRVRDQVGVNMHNILFVVSLSAYEINRRIVFGSNRFFYLGALFSHLHFRIQDVIDFLSFKYHSVFF
mmetsp:Transcript_17706/g.40144  ORF Transcript_17706/g.40144 Transcript_17706/m.40144 type:complete len:85 (+) Transcript_17706:114-368(+)